MNEEVARLVTTKSDVDLAVEFKKRLVAVYEPVMRLVDEIEAAGFSCAIG